MDQPKLNTIGTKKPDSKTQAHGRVRPQVAHESLSHKLLLEGPFWHKIPAYRDIDEQTFLDHKWQARN